MCIKEDSHWNEIINEWEICIDSSIIPLFVTHKRLAGGHERAAVASECRARTMLTQPILI